MLRYSYLIALILVALAIAPHSDAQRRQADIVQGVTSGELAITIEELRSSNAQLRARMTGIESDKARLNGKVETLEFLLSETRDGINRMQSDDAELAQLIAQLETRLQAQDETIADLNRRLLALQPEPAFLALERDDPGFDDSGSGDTAVGAEPDSSETAPAAATGPTRLLPMSDTGAVSVSDSSGQIGPDGQPLPQGSLGTLSASALPGDAGALFAEAKSRLLTFDYAGAEQAFRAFLEQFGEDPQAGEAQYWLAEVLYQQKAYPESGAAYTDMIRSYPDDPRAPEALAKLARSMSLVGDTEQACNALDLLPQRYPNASGVTRNLAAGERVRAGCDS